MYSNWNSIAYRSSPSVREPKNIVNPSNNLLLYVAYSFAVTIAYGSIYAMSSTSPRLFGRFICLHSIKSKLIRFNQSPLSRWILCKFMASICLKYQKTISSYWTPNLVYSSLFVRKQIDTDTFSTHIRAQVNIYRCDQQNSMTTRRRKTKEKLNC